MYENIKVPYHSHSVQEMLLLGKPHDNHPQQNPGWETCPEREEILKCGAVTAMGSDTSSTILYK